MIIHGLLHQEHDNIFVQKMGGLKIISGFCLQKQVKNGTKNHAILKLKKYETCKEFRAKSNRAYAVVLKNKWLDDYTWFKPSYSE